MTFTKNALEFIAVSGLLVFFSLVLWITSADLEVAGCIYRSIPGWYDVDDFPWNVIYTYAPVPGMLMAATALFLFIAGFFRQTLRVYRKQAVFLVLMLVLGPGLIVNVILKDNMGRARPSSLMEFGGTHEYSEPWQYGISPGKKSFPSGHASVAFVLMAPWFIFRYHRKTQAVLFLAGGISLGCLVGFSRMLQGGHFLSDVLWAGGLVYLCGIVLSWVLLEPGPSRAG